MIEVLSVEKRKDKNGKSYKYFKLHSPEHKITVLRGNKKVKVLSNSKTCGYISYEVNYAPSQSSDPMYNMKEGDILIGRIVSKKVEPFLASGDMKTYCSVPVFCGEEDPIEFEVETVNAFERAGKTLVRGQLNFGDFSKPKENNPIHLKVPNNCIVVQEL